MLVSGQTDATTYTMKTTEKLKLGSPAPPPAIKAFVKRNIDGGNRYGFWMFFRNKISVFPMD